MIEQLQVSDINVLILAGGFGKRLRKIVKDKPKPMVEIRGYPFLNYLICYLKKNNLKRIILSTGYMSEKIRKYYTGKDFGMEIVFSEEEKPLGTAGAIKNAEHLINSNPFMVMNGDSFCQVNFSKFLNFHLQKKSLCSMVLVKMAESCSDFGLIEIDNSARVIKFKEKVTSLKSGLISAGIYLVDRKVLGMIPENENFSIEYQLFPILKNCFGFMVKGGFVDIGTPQGLIKAENILPEMGLL